MIRIATDPIKKVAFISSYLPQKCGIATFTSDLINNTKLAGGGEFRPEIIAMQTADQLKYGQQVKLTIRKNVKADYISAADYINSSNIDIVSIQHEFGLFGGDGGSYLNIFLKRLTKPLITTMHTVLEKCSQDYLYSTLDICRASDKLVVMNKRGVKILRDFYRVPENKIRLIPHGIPDLPFVDTDRYKTRLGLKGRKTILTFGLLSKNKGIEVMLKALPTIVKNDPSVLYIILGATHPEVLRNDGNSYKQELDRIVNDFGLQQNVVFHNRFVSDNELFDFLGAADVYVTPYLHKEQLTSGTLAFAVGTGKAVVSTPYWAAEELLDKGRGKLVRFGDSEHIAQSIVDIFSNSSLLFKMRKQAYEYGRAITWPKIGRAYWRLFQAQQSLAYIPAVWEISQRDYQTPVYSDSLAYQPV